MDNLSQAIITLDVHLADKNKHLRSAWNIVHAKLAEGQKPTTNTGSPKLPDTLSDALELCHDGEFDLGYHIINGVIDQLRAGA